MKSSKLLVSVLVAATLGGCAFSSQQNAPDILDPGTAATLTSSRPPLRFYRDNSAAAAHARDFVYIGPIGVNNMGSYRYYLWFGIWSAIPNVPPSWQRDGFDSVTLFVDGEPMQLELAGWTPDAIGASVNPYVKPVASASDAYYEVTIDQIRLIANARDVSLITSGPRGGSFELWDTSQAAFASLRDFAARAAY